MHACMPICVYMILCFLVLDGVKICRIAELTNYGIILWMLYLGCHERSRLTLVLETLFMAMCFLGSRKEWTSRLPQPLSCTGRGQRFVLLGVESSFFKCALLLTACRCAVTFLLEIVLNHHIDTTL